MATGYSGWVGGDDWRTICEANVTSTGGTACTVAVSCKVESRYAYTNYCNANVSCNGQTSGTNTTGRVSTNSTTTVQTASFSVARGQSAKSVSCSAKAWMPTTGIAAYVTGASASTSVSIPALEHHTVSYDANGGEGAPAAQTKWYGTVLTLSSTVPTRANYEFLGWATSAAGAVAYQPGSKYGADKDATLYAVWNLLHTPPAVSVSVSRVSASGSTAEDAHGSWAHVSVAWETEDPATEVSASLDTGELELSGTTTGTSGACEAWAEVDQSSHIATATVSDGTMTTTATDALAQVTPVLEANGVSGLGLLTRAPETGVDVGSSMRVKDGITDFDGVPYLQGTYGEATVTNRMSDPYWNTYTCAAGIIVGLNWSTNHSLTGGSVLGRVVTTRPFATYTEKKLIRGAINSNRIGIHFRQVAENTIELTLEQDMSVTGYGTSVFMIVPVQWL